MSVTGSFCILNALLGSCRRVLMATTLSMFKMVTAVTQPTAVAVPMPVLSMAAIQVLAARSTPISQTGIENTHNSVSVFYM